jgi:hypothetical protein
MRDATHPIILFTLAVLLNAPATADSFTNTGQRSIVGESRYDAT